MTWYVHINRGKIDGNRKHDKEDPVISVRKGKSGASSYGNSVDISGPCRIRYDSNGILACGAKVVIETDTEPTIT